MCFTPVLYYDLLLNTHTHTLAQHAAHALEKTITVYYHTLFNMVYVYANGKFK